MKRYKFWIELWHCNTRRRQMDCEADNLNLLNFEIGNMVEKLYQSSIEDLPNMCVTIRLRPDEDTKL